MRIITGVFVFLFFLPAFAAQILEKNTSFGGKWIAAVDTYGLCLNPERRGEAQFAEYLRMDIVQGTDGSVTVKSGFACFSGLELKGRVFGDELLAADNSRYFFLYLTKQDQKASGYFYSILKDGQGKIFIEDLKRSDLKEKQPTIALSEFAEKKIRKTILDEGVRSVAATSLCLPELNQLFYKNMIIIPDIVGKDNRFILVVEKDQAMNLDFYKIALPETGKKVIWKTKFGERYHVYISPEGMGLEVDVKREKPGAKSPDDVIVTPEKLSSAAFIEQAFKKRIENARTMLRAIDEEPRFGKKSFWNSKLKLCEKEAAEFGNIAQ